VKLVLEDGKRVPRILWEQEFPGDILSSPVLAGGMLFVAPPGSAKYRVLQAELFRRSGGHSGVFCCSPRSPPISLGA